MVRRDFLKQGLVWFCGLFGLNITSDTQSANVEEIANRVLDEYTLVYHKILRPYSDYEFVKIYSKISNYTQRYTHYENKTVEYWEGAVDNTERYIPKNEDYVKFIVPPFHKQENDLHNFGIFDCFIFRYNTQSSIAQHNAVKHEFVNYDSIKVLLNGIEVKGCREADWVKGYVDIMNLDEQGFLIRDKFWRKPITTRYYGQVQILNKA